MNSLAPTFQAVSEQDQFLELFPHRYDFLWAEHPNPGGRPDWKTESRYPLSDRLILQGGYLYGVRFDKETNYALLDLDTNSPYHPEHDPFAPSGILSALEPLGITHSLALSSSYSGGIHIYLPFAQAQKCSSLALAIKTLLELKGFKVAPGQLEIFPDAKPYTPNSKPQLYNGHRLPLQNGSYLLTQDWQPIYSLQSEFVQRWQFCQKQNKVTKETIQQILKTYQRRQYRVSAKASKFLNDLQTEIEQGWTGHGQTNRLLGRVAMREYIFGHILTGDVPLEGIDLVQQIVKVATALPGYTEWCRHQHEIHKRAEEWARTVETSRYFHYGCRSSTLSTLQLQKEEEKASWNEQQAQTAREKIRQAIAQMLTQGTLPAGTTERFKALTKHHISGSTLYRHRDLWHPEHLLEAATEVVEIPPEPPQQLERDGRQLEKNCLPSARNLLTSNGCNTLQNKDYSDLNSFEQAIGCNTLAEQLSIFKQVQGAAVQEALEHRKQLLLERQEKRHIEQMQRYLDSGDPILIAEAIAWAQLNPDVLTGINLLLPRNPC